MKIGEKVHHEDGGNTLIVEKIYDNQDTIDQVAAIKSAGLGQTGEQRLVGRIPINVLADWIKDAGLKWHDTDAVNDLIKRKMLSGDFDKLRVWKGSY
jgi:hypothetical protein